MVAKINERSKVVKSNVLLPVNRDVFNIFFVFNLITPDYIGDEVRDVASPLINSISEAGGEDENSTIPN